MTIAEIKTLIVIGLLMAFFGLCSWLSGGLK